MNAVVTDTAAADEDTLLHLYLFVSYIRMDPVKQFHDRQQLRGSIERQRARLRLKEAPYGAWSPAVSANTIC